MNQTISAFYQCYKQPKAFLCALSSFRKHYPSSSVDLISDGGGYDYSTAAHHFNCHYSRLEKRVGDVAESTVFSQRQDFLDWLGRLVETAKRADGEYILLLEDDVVVMQPIVSSLRYDINGANTGEFLGKKIENYLQGLGISGPGRHQRFYYGGCGGSLFRKSFLVEHFSNLENVEKIIIELEPYREGRHLAIYSTDYWISVLTYYVGGTVGPYDGFCETWQRNFWFRKYVKKNIEVLHQEKGLYNKPVSEEEKKLLGEFMV